MNKYIKKSVIFLLVAGMFTATLSGCGNFAGKNSQSESENGKTYYENETSIVLSDSKITANGKKVGSNGAVFTSNDVIYYENKDFYESGNPYGEGTDDDKHTAEEAAAVTVVNITQAGTYRLSGKLSSGQIRVDLGEDAAKDKDAVVTLVFDGVDINCDVAPAVVFLNVYECDAEWDVDTATKDVDISSAGANVIVADGSTNNIEGAYVAKIFKDKDGEKKLWKQDGAFYSYMSMNINGEKENSGVLNITADNEGLCAELHLAINGGNINIISQNDGINTNEDGVSVTAINGGNIHVMAGLGVEGDGIDSNGWIVINGGTVVSAGHPNTDSGIDNENGFYANGGTVVSIGATVDWAELGSTQTTLNLQFKKPITTDQAFTITNEEGKVVFCYNPAQDDIISTQVRNCRGVVISSPDFVLGETYYLHIGGAVDGKNNGGFYDISSISGFKDAVMQVYYSNDSFGHGGFKPSPDKEYYADNRFVFNDIVSCFADITG